MVIDGKLATGIQSRFGLISGCPLAPPLESLFTHMPIHPHALHLESHVSSLIDHDTGNWRIDLIKEIFLPHDAQAILSIPLSIRRPLDRMVWAFTPKGQFIVNFTYKVALSLSQATTSSLGSTSNNQ